MNQLGDYTVKMLGQVRSGAELDVILRESTSKSGIDRLARLKLAIRYGLKKVGQLCNYFVQGSRFVF